MLKRYQSVVCGIFRVADAVIIVACWFAAYWLRFQALGSADEIPPFEKYSALAPLVGVLWVTVFTLMRLYESQRMRGLRQEVGLVTQAHVVAMLLFLAVAFTFKEYHYSRLVMAYFGTLGAVALVTFRLVLRVTLRHLRGHGYNLRHVVIVGEGRQVEQFVSHVEESVELGVRVLGIATHELSSDKTLFGKPVLGKYGDVKRIVEEHRPDGVLVALPVQHQHHMDRILSLLADEAIDVHVVPDIGGYSTLGCEVERFYDLPMVRINESPLSGGAAAVFKRMTDIVAAGIGIVIISPLLLLIALAVKLSSPGPILYSQERMGLDGRTFKMLKFRSMRIDAEQQSGAVWATKGDARCTPVGAFLRRTSLDELPQLWNVLCGDMSLVGPRPERPVFVSRFRKEIPHYMLRHKVKAGITGWAQINGWRGNTSLDRRIECDLYYIQNWSYLLDLKILTMTLWKGFVNKNAY
jgi:Undecaprenyl-phosphate glucose phosphotransferase